MEREKKELEDSFQQLSKQAQRKVRLWRGGGSKKTCLQGRVASRGLIWKKWLLWKLDSLASYLAELALLPTPEWKPLLRITSEGVKLQEIMAVARKTM